MKSQLHIIAGFKNNRTYLKNSFCTQPFKIGKITEDNTESLMKLMIMSSSPGVLDSDHYNIKIELEEDAKLQLTTQGFQRIFTMQNGAEQNVNVHLQNNASFAYLPHPNVPHKSSQYTGINNIYLRRNHNLLWSDIIKCGRKLCNEEFEFTRFQNITNVYLEDKLVIKENILLEPARRNICVIGQLEDYTHQSSLLYVNNKANNECLMQECRELLLPIDGIEFGISLLVKGFNIRMLGYKGEQLFEIQKRLGFLLGREAKKHQFKASHL